MLMDMQGNILNGHGREHTLNVFLKIAPGAQARAWVRSMGAEVTKALDQLQAAKSFKATEVPGPVFVGFYLTASGYQALGASPANVPSDGAFRAGLKSRAGALNDPPVATWDSHFQTDIGAMLLIADSDTLNKVGKPIAGSAKKKIEAMRKQLLSPPPVGINVLGEEIGLEMRNELGDGIEHFGDVDGRSQPLLLVEDRLCRLSQSRSLGSPPDAEVLQFPDACGQSAADLAQRSGLRQMAEQHRDQRVPTQQAFCGVLAPVPVHRPIEIRTGNQSQDLSKQARAT